MDGQVSQYVSDTRVCTGGRVSHREQCPCVVCEGRKRKQKRVLMYGQDLTKKQVQQMRRENRGGVKKGGQLKAGGAEEWGKAEQVREVGEMYRWDLILGCNVVVDCVEGTSHPLPGLIELRQSSMG